VGDGAGVLTPGAAGVGTGGVTGFFTAIPAVVVGVGARMTGVGVLGLVAATPTPGCVETGVGGAAGTDVAVG
jgi:hypothetical protein